MPTPATGLIEAGDRVWLVPADGEGGPDAGHLVVAGGEPTRVKGLGVVDLGNLVDHPWGTTLRVGQKTLVPLPPLPVDAMRAAERGPQIVRPQDAARILLECGVRPGTRVLEVGSGSGVLTVALAGAVGSGGRVVSLDHRKEHQEVARRNVETAGYGDRVEFVVGQAEAPPEELLERAEEAPFDALVLDVPNPDEAVPKLAPALAVGGALSAYVPTVRQVEKLRGVLAEGPWTAVRTLEQLERVWHVGDRGSRPEFDMLGHTGFLTFARRTRGRNAEAADAA